MKLPVIVTVALSGIFSGLSVSAQTAAGSTGWAQKPGGSTVGHSQSVTPAGTSSVGSNKLLHSAPGSTLNSSMSTAVYGATPVQNSLISHNRHYRSAQRHSDANNPLLHSQPASSTGFGSPATLTPPASSGWQKR